MKQDSRKQFYIEKSIQGRLAARCIVYWCSCLASLFLFLFAAKSISQQSATPSELFLAVYASHAPVMLVSLLLIPLVIWDMIRFSHRVVGPLFRLEREMRRLADGESVRPVQFRDGDYWHGLATQFNALRSRHLQLDHHAQIDGDDKKREPAKDDPVDRELSRFPA